MRRLTIPHIRKSLIPVTILVVPHTRGRSLRLRIPILAVYACLGLAAVGAGWLVHLSLEARAYYSARARLRSQVRQVQSSIDSLKSTEEEVRGLFSLKPASLSSSKVAAEGDMIDMDALSKQVRQAVDSIAEIKAYLRQKHNEFFAIPAGLPVEGPVTSFFGPRGALRGHAPAFHHGMDIQVPPGTPVRATADGVVSFAGRMNGSGNVVVIEHGMGYSTAYAHGSRNLVRVGQRVRRGDVICASGATGFTTGPHVHYEVWRDGSQIDPLSLMTGGNRCSPEDSRRSRRLSARAASSAVR